MHQISILLHSVRSAHNVGSIFRTAECAGVSMIYLSGVTPAPMDRFGRVQKEIRKVALGAERLVQWERPATPRALISKLRAEGWNIVGVEQDARSKNYRHHALRGRTLFIFGNEVRGIPKSVRGVCDALVEIPLHGEKESLNVSVTAGIILFDAISR